jgi:hypothetical protein
LPRSLHVKHSAALFAFDIVGYFPRLRSDSFMTRTPGVAKESINHMWGVFRLFDTNIYRARVTRYVDRMLRRVTRINSATKGTFGAELVVRAIF